MTKNIRPFVKWAGGKRQLLPVINENLPMELKKGKINKYIEPFLGGGAVLFDLITRYDFKEIIVNDYNADLINLYTDIRDNIELLMSKLDIISTEYLDLEDEQRAEYFYSIRQAYNDTSRGSIEKSVYLLFLNRTCFNGLFRVNSKGLFNVPHGRYKNPMILDRENLMNVSQALHNVKLISGDFSKIKTYVDENTFIYFDPPYRPLSSTSHFTSYGKNGFDDEEQIRLTNFFHELDNLGAKMMLSNSDPTNTDPDDMFFDNLYSKYSILRVNARRTINSNSSRRGAINELLITNY